MDIEADLKWIHQELDKVTDPSLIKTFKRMLEYKKEISSERISVEQYNKEIKESIAQIESGKVFTHQEMKERIQKWANE